MTRNKITTLYTPRPKLLIDWYQTENLTEAYATHAIIVRVLVGQKKNLNEYNNNLWQQQVWQEEARHTDHF